MLDPITVSVLLTGAAKKVLDSLTSKASGQATEYSVMTTLNTGSPWGPVNGSPRGCWLATSHSKNPRD